MNTASLELCKELYTLSKWAGVGKHPDAEPTLETFVPAYDLGYLLRKLPPFIQLTQLSGGYTPSGWRAEKNVSQVYPGHYKADADTPEDAPCKLAIELFKEGILK